MLTFKASNGKFFSAEYGGGIDPRAVASAAAFTANRETAGGFETFGLIQHDDGRVSFQTYGGYLMTADGGGGSFLRSDATEVGEWEKFTLVDHNDGKAIQTSDGIHFVCAEELTQDVPLTATRTTPAAWETFTVSGLQPPHVDPSGIPLETLADIRGCMWPVRGPWRFGPRPYQPDASTPGFHPQPDNITALEYIYSFGDTPYDATAKLSSEQEGMLRSHTDKGFTHCAFGPINAQSYHGQYPDFDFSTPEQFEAWLDWLQLFWDRGLAPICFLHADGETFEQTVARYDHLIRGNARAQRLMRIVVPTGWEPTRYDWSSVTWAKYCAWARELLPNALVLIHTVTDVDAPVGTDAAYDDNGKSNGAGWARVAEYIHGWLIQNGPYTQHPDDNPRLAEEFAAQFDSEALGARYHSARWHFVKGIDGWPTFSAWGNTPIKLYAAEQTSFEAYWHNLPYSVSTAWGDLAMRAGADGFLDGGTV